jgi:hypothetical protein
MSYSVEDTVMSDEGGWDGFPGFEASTKALVALTVYPLMFNAIK